MAAKEKKTVSNTIAHVRESAGEQVDALVKLEHQAVAELKVMAKKTGKLAKDNPGATAGVLLGAGAVMGAIAHAVLAPRPTLRESMMDALRSSARRVKKLAH